VDDVEDNATLRRGYPVAHSLFGIAQTINSSNYMLFVALQKILELGSEEAVRIYSGMFTIRCMHLQLTLTV
jgi:geranylgeranyl diphosphate synthase type 3